MDIGKFAFSGYAVTMGGKLGVFNVANKQVLPAIYQSKKTAINDAYATVTKYHPTQDIALVKVEVFSDGSLLILSKDNKVLTMRTFDVKLLIGLNLKKAQLHLCPNWIGVLSRANEKYMRTNYASFAA